MEINEQEVNVFLAICVRMYGLKQAEAKGIFFYHYHFALYK